MLIEKEPSTAANSSGGKVVTLPSNVLNPVFGKVSYRAVGTEVEVTFTILPTGLLNEGWQTGVALDASSSMREAYGKSLTGYVPSEVNADYIKRGWVREETRDGAKLPMYQAAAYEDAIGKGYLKWTENTVEPEARKFIQYLADNMDADGGTTVIYWACGQGNAIELLGDVRGEQCATLAVGGPANAAFGTATQLLPALRYFDERFEDAKNGMYIFVTDGRLDDLSDVKAYCVKLAKRIEAGGRNPMKCVLIGLGPEIDESQMIELDDLDTGTSLDIWDHKIAADMREVTDILADLQDETTIPGVPMATIYDDNGNVAKRFTDGLPGRVTFRMPETSTSFELEVPGQDRIRQSIVVP